MATTYLIFVFFAPSAPPPGPNDRDFKYPGSHELTQEIRLGLNRLYWELTDKLQRNGQEQLKITSSSRLLREKLAFQRHSVRLADYYALRARDLEISFAAAHKAWPAAGLGDLEIKVRDGIRQLFEKDLRDLYHCRLGLRASWFEAFFWHRWHWEQEFYKTLDLDEPDSEVYLHPLCLDIITFLTGYQGKKHLLLEYIAGWDIFLTDLCGGGGKGAPPEELPKRDIADPKKPREKEPFHLAIHGGPLSERPKRQRAPGRPALPAGIVRLDLPDGPVTYEPVKVGDRWLVQVTTKALTVRAPRVFLHDEDNVLEFRAIKEFIKVVTPNKTWSGMQTLKCGGGGSFTIGRSADGGFGRIKAGDVVITHPKLRIDIDEEDK